MDQYRITREVPLPYSFDDVLPESDEDEGGISGTEQAKGAKKGEAAERKIRGSLNLRRSQK